MRIEKDTVVSLTYELSDLTGQVMEKPELTDQLFARWL